MLFILVIDILNSLIKRAVSSGILQRLTIRHAASSVPLYADDIVIFFHPDIHDILPIREFLRVFGVVSGLHTNFSKCFTTPIQCSDEHLAVLTDELRHPIAIFPPQYLGLLLSIRKVPTRIYALSW